MRVLYVDANVWHINPTANLLPLLFRAHLNATFYGPGFSPAQTLSAGLRTFITEKGPFDVLFVGPNTPFIASGEEAIDGAIGYIKRYTAHRLDLVSAQAFFAEVRALAGKLEVPVKLVSALTYDYYATTQGQVDMLLEKGFGVLGPNEQFVLRLADLPSFAIREKHFIKKAERLSDIWRDFMLAYPERVLTAVHFVGLHEFFFEPLDARPWQASVPGVEYVLRRESQRQLKSSPLRSAPKRYFNLYRIANRLQLPAFSHPVALRLYNLLFQRSLADTRCIYTARGGFGIPIRKFFEIPAAGGLMLCSPCNGFSDLGFVAGRDYVAVEPADVVDAIRAWLNDPAAQTVASAGQAVAMTKHSLKARGQQVARCLSAMVAGSYCGSRWQDGEFVLNGEASCAD